MARLMISLMGAFQVMLHGRPAHPFDSAKVRSLLAYLVVEAGRPHARETLAATFWPEQDDRAGRHSLSQALSNLRRVIGDQAAVPPFLLINRYTVQWNTESDYALDVAWFEGRLTAVARHRHLRQEQCAYCLEQLEQAIALYQGDFLTGLAVGGLFEEWLLQKRGQLERDMVNALHRLAALHEARGDYAQARQYARRQITLDPWHEPAHQQLMRTYAWDGRRAAALRQYRELAQLLEQELHTFPSIETTQLFEAIRDRALAPPEAINPFPAISATDNAPEARPIFVGREAELNRLLHFVNTAVSGNGRLAFIVGETGSGKTALLQELAWRAQDSWAELVVASGSGNALTGRSDPYLPFRELLSLLTGEVAAQPEAGLSQRQIRRLQASLPIIGQALLTAGPDLIDTFIPGQPLLERAMAQARYTAESWAAGQGGWLAQLEERLARQTAATQATSPEQSRLFAQFTDVLKRIAGQRPLLLLLDDLQWADAASLNLLFHLGRNLKQSRLLIVAAYRAEDVALGREGDRHPLASLVNEFKRAYGDIDIDLDTADEQTARHFVDAFLDSQPNRLSENFRAALYRQTDGHPLFLVELLRDLVARGDLVHDAHGRWVEKAGVDWQTLPARVEGAIGERIGRLDVALQEALAIAAVEGETFTAEVIAQVQAASERAVVRRLSHELHKQHHLVTPLGIRQVGSRRLSLYRFRHNLFQKYVYGRLDPAERAYLHEDVGTVLETLYAGQTADIIGQLARHFQAAGQPLRAIRYLRQAGDKAMRLSAYPEAVILLSQSLDLLKTAANSPERTQEELAVQIALGIAYSVTRGFASPQVEQAFGRARALSQQMGAVPELFPALWGLFYYYLVRAEDRAMRDLAEQLRQMAASVEDPLLRPIGHWAKGVTLLYAGELDPAHAHLEEMRAYYDPQQSRAAIFRYVTDPGVACQFWSAWALWLRGYPDQSLNRSYEALALAQRLDHPFSLAFALFTSAALHQFRREPREAYGRANAAIALAKQHGFLFFEELSRVFCGWALTEQGQVAEGMKLMQEGLTAAQATGARIGIPHMLSLLAEAHGKAGETAEGLTLLAEALTAAHDSGERHYEAEIHRLRGELLRQSGADAAQAEACFLKAIEIARQQQAKSWELRATTSLAQLWRAQGKTKEAKTLLSDIYNWFSEGGETLDLTAAKTLLDELKLDSTACE
jgi:predicted ATPase/DNA-binding SARP family transcriptional activator